MRIELANKIRDGRAVGNEFVVTRGDETPARTGIIARFDTREEAAAFIAWGNEPCTVTSCGSVVVITEAK